MATQPVPEPALREATPSEAESLVRIRTRLHQANADLTADFKAGVPVAELVERRARVVDEVLAEIWLHWVDPRSRDIALVAVGGYGRGELHPHSDIDLLVLEEGPSAEAHAGAIEHFLTFLWDIGLHVGHSVRTLHECVQAAEIDITIATNLMESRLLSGPEDLHRRLRARIGPDCIWPSRRFFEAKLREQRARHRKFHDTAYNLEPNVKEGPGGLRDIQMVGWVTKRHFGAQTLHELVAHGFLTEAEYRLLQAGQNFLWQIRFGLHILSGRREERLLFDYQRQLASLFGYRDQGHRLGVELFMRKYYQTVMELGRLNEMLLQLFREAILHSQEPGKALPINRRFQVRRGFLEVTRDDVFRRQPLALLEVFLLLQQRPDIKGVRASTIRLIREHRHLIDDSFRQDLRARSLFMEILRQPRGLSHELRRMHRYGVLGAYVPAFGAVIGLMQRDLFHVYTVDEHSLFVVRNLRRLAEAQFSAELPMASSIMRQLPKPELLYLAGLFHDIAKGRGGDHSELGAHEALEFCRNHGLPSYDARLVEWLVRHHLIMSMTAQRRDISDPDVINAFAAKVEDPVRLDYLYLLTVADIRATNPTLWNAWKDALLSELYLGTRRVLRRGLETPLDQSARVREAQGNAAEILREGEISAAALRELWATLDDDYFLRHSAEEIAWHSRAILAKGQDLPLVMVRAHTERGGTALCVYALDHPQLFAITTSALDQLGLNIVDARIITTRTGHTLETYMVLDEDGKAVEPRYRLEEIVDTLRQHLARPYQPPSARRRVARAVKHFPIETRVNFSPDPGNHRTVMEVIATDRPGLLSRIARALTECGVRLQNAKVATLGARAEDLFFISDQDHGPLSDAERLECLRQRVRQYVDVDS
jgi:[protein-PII] uridylyltransferase